MSMIGYRKSDPIKLHFCLLLTSDWPLVRALFLNLPPPITLGSNDAVVGHWKANPKIFNLKSHVRKMLKDLGYLYCSS